MIRQLMMMRLGLALALLAAGCGEDDSDPPTGPMEYRVLHYDYAFDIETRDASVTLTLDVLAGGDCLDIPMRAGVPEQVTLGGAPIRSGLLDGGVLTLCGAGWEAGSQITMTASMQVAEETWGDSQVGYSVWTDRTGNPFYYMVSWVGGCDRFGPCDSAPDRFARYTFTIDHPSGVQVFCPGTITPGQTRTTCEFAHGGGPTYSTFGFAAGPSFSAVSLGNWDGIEVTLHDIPGSGIAEAFEVENVRGFLAWMESQFGPYPYGDTLRLVVGPTYWAGFEHPGNIVLSDQLVPFPGNGARLTHTSIHEIGHMWAGDQTTLASTQDFVWKESMVEYLAFQFEETIDPARALATAEGWKRSARGALYYPVPAEAPPLLDFYGDVYGPGPMILFRQLEGLFDRARVMAALEMLLGQERAIGVLDVKAALESALAVDLTGYFDAWVFGSGAPDWPVFDVDISEAGGSYDVRLSRANPESGAFGCAFALRLTGDQGESHEVWIDLGLEGSSSYTATVTPGFAVTGHELDPHANCLATESTATATEPAQRPLHLSPSAPRRYR